MRDTSTCINILKWCFHTSMSCQQLTIYNYKLKLSRICLFVFGLIIMFNILFIFQESSKYLQIFTIFRSESMAGIQKVIAIVLILYWHNRRCTENDISYRNFQLSNPKIKIYDINIFFCLFHKQLYVFLRILLLNPLKFCSNNVKQKCSSMCMLK